MISARVPDRIETERLLLHAFRAEDAEQVLEAVNESREEIGRWMSPLKLFEYMAAGKPILASDIPALREILADGGTALLLPPGDVAAWAAAARALLADPARAAALGARARAAWGRRPRRCGARSAARPHG